MNYEMNQNQDGGSLQNGETDDREQRLQESIFRSPADAAEQVASRTASAVVKKRAADVTKQQAKETGTKAAGKAGRQAAEGSIKKAAGKAGRQAAAEAVKKGSTEAAKQMSRVAASETVKDAASYVFASSASTAGTAAGSAFGSAAGPVGLVVGAGAGKVIGTAADAGFTTADQTVTGIRQSFKTFQESIRQEGNIWKPAGKMVLSGASGLRKLISIQMDIAIPGLSMVKTVLAVLAVSLCIFIMITGLLLAGVVTIITGTVALVDTYTSSLGSLAGGQEVVYYCQYEEPWADYAYGDSTISVCGCGPTTMAVVVSTLTGQAYTPADAADDAMSGNYYFNGVGTMWTYFTNGCPAGLQAVNHGQDLMTALECIPDGGMVVVVLGNKDGEGNELYTGDGHFMAIRGITSEGKLLVADPASRSNSEAEWDYYTVEEILKNCWSITYDAAEDVHGEQQEGD